MRPFVFVLLLAATTSCKLKGSLASLVAFEGEIDMSMTMAMAPTTAMTTSFELKGTKMRNETNAGAYVTISDTETKTTWMLDTIAHTYTELDLARVSSTSSSAVKSRATSRSLGKSDKVAGYSCDLWEVVDAAMHTELCMASGMSMIALGLTGPFSTATKGSDAWTEVLSHGFPLRMIMSDPSGKPMMKMEATRIDKRSVPDSEFQIPAGYTKTPMPI